MTDRARLERRYQRLLAWYPKAFRQEHEQEMLAVLMAGAGDERRTSGLADSADLIRNGIRMRLRSDTPRSARAVLWAARLMVLGAALELAALGTVLATQDSLRSAIVRHFPHFTAAQWHTAVNAHLVPVEIGAPIAAVVWLWMAWANRRGHRWARVLLVVLFGLTSLSLLSALAQDAATYAPVDLIAGCALWLVGLVAVLLSFSPRSGQHYGRPHRPARGNGSAARWPAPEHV